MNKQLIIPYLLICACLCMCIYALNKESKSKIVVVDAIKLCNNYKMKIELEKIDSVKLSVWAAKVDSITNIINALQSSGQKSLNPQIIQEYKMAKYRLEQEYQMSNQNINEQVWKRLNPLIDEWGKKNHFGIIIGANGMGSVLYNDEMHDETLALTDYVNKLYENK